MRTRTVIGSLVTAALVLALATPAAAQDQPVTVSGGVSFFHFNDCCTEPGVLLQIAKPLGTGPARTGAMKIAGEFGYTSSDGGSTLTLGGGPQFPIVMANSSAQPYVHVMVGLARYGFDEDSVNNLFIGPGGGVMFPVNDRVRVFGQIDIMIIKGDGFTDFGQRFVFGANFNVGQ